MAARKPLVIVAGEIEQLQAGDYLNVPISGYTELVATNDEAGPIVIGTAVYMDAADGVKKARANAVGTAIVIGLVADASIASAAAGGIATEGILTGTTGQWDAVTGQVGGLSFGVRYYLDPTTAGMISITAPTTVGQLVCELGVGLSTTEMKINIQKRVLL